MDRRSLPLIFAGLIFVDACDHAHYTLYNRARLIFTDSSLCKNHEN